VILVGLAAVAVDGFAATRTPSRPATGTATGHMAGVAWLLALPPLALVLIGPPALGRSRPAARPPNHHLRARPGGPDR
jgi:hypothetical protein